MTDRFADGYEPDFDIDAAVGRQGELLVHNLINALKDGASVEVKTDERFTTTGNVYIEYQCFRLGAWRDSGIATTKAELWCQVFGASQQAGILVMQTSRLRTACRSLWRDEYTASCPRGSHPTRGVCAPLVTFLRYYRSADETQGRRAA